MANITEVNNYDSTVPLLATGQLIQGGVGGSANSQAQALADRTNWLYNQLAAEVTNRTNAISAETTRAEGAEGTLTTNLNAEITNRTNAINTEVTNRTNAISAETTRAEGAESTLTTNLNAEITRAEGAEGTLTTNLNAEISNRGTAIATVTGLVNAETNRAEIAESLLAPLASPALTGTPTAPTPTTGDNSTKIATTAFVHVAIPSGAVLPFAGQTAPSSWLECDGSSQSTSGATANLFAVIGYTYGGSGSSFNLPDLRGVFVRGWAHTETTYDSGRALGSTQQDAFQGVNYSLISKTQSGLTTTGVAATGITGNGYTGVNGTNTNDPVIQTGGAVSDGVHGAPRVASETRPVNVAMMYCIKL